MLATREFADVRLVAQLSHGMLDGAAADGFGDAQAHQGGHGLAGLLDLMGQGFDGGTDLQAPIERAIARVHQARWASADLLIVSDGEFGCTPAMLARISWRLPSWPGSGRYILMQWNICTDKPQLWNEISLIGEYTGAKLFPIMKSGSWSRMCMFAWVYWASETGGPSGISV